MKPHCLFRAAGLMLGVLMLGICSPFIAVAQVPDLPGISDDRFLTPIADPGSIAKFTNDLPVVQKLGIRFDAIGTTSFPVRCTQVEQDMIGDGHMTKLLGFAVGNLPATHPGATIVAQSGTPVHVTWINDFGFTYPLPIDTSIMWAYSMGEYKGRTIANNGVPFVPHLHGAHSDAIYDGLPEQWWTPLYHTTSNPLSKGPDFVTNVYTYDNSQEAATLWYHDHTLGITRLNAYLGLAGFYFVRDANELNHIANRAIPSDTCEIELAIQDKVFWPNGQLAVPNVITTDRGIPTDIMVPEFFGNVICVNGKVWPKLNVSPMQYRFRIVNASDSRFYHMWLEAEDNPGHPISFKQIGTEDGLLQSPVTLDSVLIGCGERYDIVVNFAGLQGKRIIVRNDAGTPFGNANPDPVDENTGVVMRFDVRNETVVDPVTLASTLRPAIAPLVQTAPATRDLILAEMMDEYGRTMPMLGTAADGAMMFMDPVTENIKLNEVETWRIFNTTMDAHPIHLHLVSFQVISRQRYTATGAMGGPLGTVTLEGSPVTTPPELSGWKDTDVMYPGEVTTIRARFDKPGTYVWHCHILSHEEHDMMRKFYVRHALVAPVLLSPANQATGVLQPATFSWNPVLDAETYRLEVSRNQNLNNPVVNLSGLTSTSYTLPAGTLENNKIYYWRVTATNVDGTGPQSAVFSFTTDGTTGPLHFLYTGNTGTNSIIGIPNTAELLIDGLPIVSGDEIGVFNAAGLCVGGVIWQGLSTALPVWGDNSVSPAVDGMTDGETFYFRIWNHANGLEYIGAEPVFSSGNGVYANGAMAVLSSLHATTYPAATHAYVIPPGWNMISSYVRPANTAIANICAPFVDNMVLMKNGAGLAYWPSLSIMSLTTWNNAEGYQVYMEHAGTSNFIGTIERPETKHLSLPAGWNMVGYLRYTSQAPDVAFNTIAPQLVLAKNNYGQVYWPAYGINTIPALQPGQGYQLYLSAPGTLTYPANNALPPVGVGSLEPSSVMRKIASTGHFVPSWSSTGSNATLLVRFKGNVPDLDEVAVRNRRGDVVGAGSVANRQAVVTLWGDNTATKDIDGASDGDALALSYWSAAEKAERYLTVEGLSDGTGAALGTDLVYRTDAIMIADVVEGSMIPTTVSLLGTIPTDFVLAQNYPNPFNPSTKILYGLPRASHVSLDVYDVLGQRIARVVDEVKPAGYYETAFDASHLASGIYIYRLAAGDFVQVKRMLLVR